MDGLPTAEQHQEIRVTVVVVVRHGPDEFLGGDVEFFEEVGARIEIPVRGTADERASFVLLNPIGSPVEIRVDRNAAEFASCVVEAPHIGSTVVVRVLGRHVTVGPRTQFDCEEDTADSDDSGGKPLEIDSHAAFMLSEILGLDGS